MLLSVRLLLLSFLVRFSTYTVPSFPISLRKQQVHPGQVNEVDHRDWSCDYCSGSTRADDWDHLSHPILSYRCVCLPFLKVLTMSSLMSVQVLRDIETVGFHHFFATMIGAKGCTAMQTVC